jgi:molybdopterin molybdotransferase
VSSPPLSVDETRSRILGAVEPLPPIELPLLEAHGCVVAESVVAEYGLPPLTTAETAGYAVRAADIHAATEEAFIALRLVGWARVGKRPEATVGWGEAVRIEAGAPLPAGSDCVLPLTSAALEGENLKVRRSIQPGAHVRAAGQDVGAGDVLVPAGRRLAGPELGILAAAGRSTAPVHAKVRVAVLSIGRLVEPGRAASFGEALDAVSYLLCGAVRDAGAVPYRVGIITEPESLRETLVSNLSRADVFVSTGGSLFHSDSEGESERESEGLGKIESFRVAAYPVERLDFGEVDGETYFGLPPEPSAALIAFEAFVRPAILKMMGREDLARPEVTAVLDEEVSGPRGATLFLPARVEHRDGAWHVRPSGPVGGGMLGPIVRANALAVIDPGDAPRTPGRQVRVQPFRRPAG